MALDLSTRPASEPAAIAAETTGPTGSTQVSMHETIEMGRTCANEIEDAAIAIGLYAGARVKDGQGELVIRLVEPPSPPVRSGLRVT